MFVAKVKEIETYLPPNDWRARKLHRPQYNSTTLVARSQKVSGIMAVLGCVDTIE